MLEPREADIPVLFLVLVVLPLVAYILLGKWSEAAKKRERISLLAQLAAAEALRAEAMAAASVVPVVSPLKNLLHECARCFGPATTRCARCKSVRYCSGKCQIIHWRQVHKNECQKLDTNSSSSSLWAMSMEEFIHESALLNDNMSSQLFEYSTTPAMMEKTYTDNIICPSMSTGSSSTAACSAIGTHLEAAPERRAVEKRNSGKSNREMSRREHGAVVDFSEKASESRISSSSCSDIIPPKEVYKRHKLRSNDSHVPEGTSRRSNASSSNVHNQGTAASRSTMHESNKFQSEHTNTFEPGSNCGSSLYSLKTGTNAREIEADYISDGGFYIKGGTAFQNATKELNCSSETTATKGSVKAKTALHSRGTKISKSLMSTIKVSGEQLCSEKERKGQSVDESKVVARMRDNIPGEGSNGVASMGMKMMGLRKSTKLAREDAQEVNGDRHKKLKMLFPYEEFVKFFQCEVFDLSPRGLINCGNSCYANAVLQCLTCTKPLVIYLLCRSHSRACWAKDWCLMCELEQYVKMLRESGGPLSPNRILSHVRRINCQIGYGSQEDAHEYLRLLIASMQSICLEGLGGENKVDSRLQKTTFIQHTFGGSLRSKVKCLICHHESERYENIMDLTLEIYGWVESLEDALTQFTTPEDLDGENMYRCGRCAAYVRARKQLSVHEAPNVLTIVLKRFQEGRYGKLNKCITFPDMLDMIPFMTGVDDMPPLYMLYAVVVHLDTLNASFSGHYVSYVKDLQGNWYRVDDTEVQLVPVSQVMSEGAYILFYIRSCPRPQRAFTGKALRQQTPSSARHCPSKAQKSSGPGHSKPCSDSVGLEPLSDLTPQCDTGFSNRNSNEILRRSANRNITPMMETFAEPAGMEFSDATSSDWSLFTSSDEASFTTESARDSFSTVDYADAYTIGPIASIYRTLYASDYSCNKVSCGKFSSGRSETRFVSEEKGYVLDSYLSNVPIDRLHNPKQVTDSFN